VDRAAIGALYRSSPDVFFDGMIDDVRVYDVALTQREVGDLYNGPNAAPTADAGSNQTIALPSTASLDGTVSDDGNPSGGTVTQTWSKDSGPGAVTFANANAADTTATFSTSGTYVLRLSAFDTALTASDTVTVVVQSAAARGDFNGDGKVDIDDVNALYAVLGTNVPPTDVRFDLNNDGKVDIADAKQLVQVIIGTSMADTNLDKSVDIVDLGSLANRYGESGGVGDGDTDGNGTIDIVDLGNLADDYGKTY
jgi:hypothetical protein